MFYSYIEYKYNGRLDERKYELVTYMEEFFDSGESGTYFIMDPYLEIDTLQKAFKENNVEEVLWCFLLSVLAGTQVSFNIITREKAENIIVTSDDPPFTIPISSYLNNSTVQVCIYTDTKFSGLGIHDRYILKENETTIKGMHLGPSLGQVDDKDITVTILSDKGTTQAIKYFKLLWGECKNKKGWKKG